MFFRSSSQFLRFPNVLKIRQLCLDNEPLTKVNSPNQFISQVAHLLEIDWMKCRDIMSDHRKILSMKYDDIEEIVQTLQELNYSKEHIRENPPLLYTGAVTLRNRYKILQECGCVNISAGILSKYLVVMNRPIKVIKMHGLILEKTNVIRRLVDSFKDIHLSMSFEENDDNLLKMTRELVLNTYLKERLNMTETQIQKTWQSYYRVRHRSFDSVSRMVNILITDLKFPIERIIKNSFVLYGDPVNVRQMIDEVKKIGDEDIRDILYRRPKIMMGTCKSLKKSIEHIKAFGISEKYINKCLDILTLGSDTILERLQEMDSIEEFRVLKSNPRILRLVHYQTKARLRLEYLNQLKIKCASLHVLSSHTDAFVKFTKEGSDKFKGCDSMNYLAGVLNRSTTEVRDVLVRHPNWCHVPTITVTHSYEFLVSKWFSNDDIFANLQLLLYPIDRIKNKLNYLQTDEACREMKLPNKNAMTLSNQQILALCLYLIEQEFHFTGDGIWTEQDLHPMENFNNILPDFPTSWQRGYKYGTKPNILNRIDIKSDILISA